MLLALKLILAHFLGDFVFQPAKWVDHKLKKKAKSKYLYYHIAVHLLALIVVLQFNNWGIVAITIVSHYLIDLAKLNFTNEKNYRWLFTLDQILHLAVIAVVVYFYEPYTLDINLLFTPQLLLFICMLAFVSYVSAILIKMLMAPYIEELAKDDKENKEGTSLKNAGRYIGMLERIFVFAFILLHQWAAIGLLITAKSVFRFGDLNKGKNRKLTEYVLIGTLLSFGLAILAGLAYNYLITFLS
ncbi:DUF3307 domain-containing protein [Croceitalea sp. MTPC9]|nr:DUF3307 domain-containing protein [Croceitalea sp. MTPC6]GMN17137.1 DUF3307 domain-containing protein [Croceitalea sp. MTPC9]